MYADSREMKIFFEMFKASECCSRIKKLNLERAELGSAEVASLLATIIDEVTTLKVINI